MRSLFPKLEVTIPCDLNSLVMLLDDPLCFVNNDSRIVDPVKFETTVTASQWSEVERQQCLAPNPVLIFEYFDENKKLAKDIEDGEYYSQGEETIVSSALYNSIS